MLIYKPFLRDMDAKMRAITPIGHDLHVEASSSEGDAKCGPTIVGIGHPVLS